MYCKNSWFVSLNGQRAKQDGMTSMLFTLGIRFLENKKIQYLEGAMLWLTIDQDPLMPHLNKAACAPFSAQMWPKKSNCAIVFVVATFLPIQRSHVLTTFCQMYSGVQNVLSWMITFTGSTIWRNSQKIEDSNNIVPQRATHHFLGWPACKSHSYCKISEYPLILSNMNNFRTLNVTNLHVFHLN